MLRRLGVVVGLAALATLIVAERQSAPAQTNPQCDKPPEVKQMSMMMDWLPYFSWAPFIAAENEGFFADEGIEVNVIEPPSVADPIKLLVTNKVSFAISYVPALYSARDKGIPVKGIAALQRNLSAQLYWLPDTPIKSVADLKGKTIALTAKLDERAYVKALLASAGLTLKDVTTVNPGWASSRLLIDGKVDATHGVVTNPASVAGLGGPSSLKSFKYRDHGVPNYPWLVITSTDSFLAKNPAATCRFLRAASRGADVAVGRRSKTQALAVEINKMNPSYSTKTLVHHARLMAPDFHDDQGRFGTLVIKDWETARAWMIDTGIIHKGSKVTANDVATNDYLPGDYPSGLLKK